MFSSDPQGSLTPIQCLGYDHTSAQQDGHSLLIGISNPAVIGDLTSMCVSRDFFSVQESLKVNNSDV